MFWSIAISLLVFTGLATLWPLLGQGSRLRPAAAMLVLLLPIAGYVLYQQVGTPRALDMPESELNAAAAGDMNALTRQLRSRLEENPENVEGWILLGRSYKTLQQFPQALEALEQAYRLEPGHPLVVVELVEAQLFASGDPRISPEMADALEQAVTVDPALQKGLWLLGIAAAQAGNDARAVDWWGRLLSQLDPASNIAHSVLEQIEQARQRMGDDPAVMAMAQESESETPSWPGVDITVEYPVSSEPGFSLPPDAALYIIAREQGAGGGPPLGVSRVPLPEFPLQLRLTDENSMMPQRPISSVTGLSVQARLSMNGQPVASAGDIQSQAESIAVNEDESSVKLILAQPVD